MGVRRQYIQELENIHIHLQEFGQVVLTTIAQSVDSLIWQDVTTAKEVIDADAKINQLRYDIEEEAVTLIARQQPVAGDLRLLIAAIEIAGELERIGDYAKGIAKIVVRNGKRPFVLPQIALPQMAEQVQLMLASSLQGLVHKDVVELRDMAQADDRVDRMEEEIHAELLRFMHADPGTIHEATDLLFTIHYLERIADRATNVAEHVIFIINGETIELNA